MVIPLKYRDLDGYCNKYLSLFQGELHLTDKELQVLKALIKDLVFQLEVHSEDFSDEIIFGIDNTVKICKGCNISLRQYIDIKTSLVSKKAILKDANGRLMLNRLLIPQAEITFKFISNE